MKQRIGLLLVCTGRYDCFIPQLMEGIEKYFFPNNELTIFIFSDKKGLIKPISERIKVVETEIEHKPFPYTTLYRYKYFLMREKEIQRMCDYVFYMDVDMKVVGEVLEENIIVEPFEVINAIEKPNKLIVTQHPAYAFADKSWWGSQGVNIYSDAYLPREKWGINTGGFYCAGGFQGGSKDAYLSLCHVANNQINTDEEKGVMAEYHDESHLNKIINTREGFLLTVLPFDYCCQEGRETATTKIIALNKNHEEIRS